MKFVAALALLATLSATSAFVVTPPARAQTLVLQAKAAASSKEEDLELTRKVIAKFAGIESSDEAPPPPKKEEAKEE